MSWVDPTWRSITSIINQYVLFRMTSSHSDANWKELIHYLGLRLLWSQWHGYREYQLLLLHPCRWVNKHLNSLKCKYASVNQHSHDSIENSATKKRKWTFNLWWAESSLHGLGTNEVAFAHRNRCTSPCTFEDILRVNVVKLLSFRRSRGKA